MKSPGAARSGDRLTCGVESRDALTWRGLLGSCVAASFLTFLVFAATTKVMPVA